MNKSKKLFNSEDFDKKKSLFKPEDFDKPAVSGEHGVPRTVPHHPQKKSNVTKIIGWFVVAGIIIAGVIFLANKDKDNDSNKITTEATAQKGENHCTDNKSYTKEPKGNTKAALSDMAKEKNAANETNSEPSVVDENHVTTSTEKSPNSSSNRSENNVDDDVETNARRVIHGDFGNGQERKDKLGSSYSEIQGKVNEMYRQNLVH